MKKSFKIILWIIIGLLAILFLPDASMYYRQIKLKFETLPEVYKSYPTIDSINDDYYEVLEIESDYSLPLLQVNDTTIVISGGYSKETEDGSKAEKNIWYKINLQGQIIDSLKYEYNDRKEERFYRTYHGGIVDIINNTYNTWLKNSNSTTKPFKNLKENKVFTAKEANHIVEVKELMNVERISSEGDKDEAKYKLIVYEVNVWNYLYTDKDWSGSETYSINNLALKHEQLPYEIDKKPGLIKRVFVKKEKWIGSSFWHLDFGWGGGPRGDRWDGTSYFEITMPKKKLYFQQPVEIEYPDEDLRDRFTYNVYKPKNGDYLVLNNIEHSRYYLIRPKVVK